MMTDKAPEAAELLRERFVKAYARAKQSSHISEWVDAALAAKHWEEAASPILRQLAEAKPAAYRYKINDAFGRTVWTFKLDSIERAAVLESQPLYTHAVPAVQAPAVPSVPVGMPPQRFQWTCANGCGVCKVKRIEFEYERTMTLDGDLVSRKTTPQLVSACCGADLSMWDAERDEEIEVASVEFPHPLDASPLAQPKAPNV